MDDRSLTAAAQKRAARVSKRYLGQNTGETGKGMDRMKRIVLQLALVSAVAPGLWGATFGKVVPIGGHASDIALDERRGVLYIANFTANRIEVMSLDSHAIRRAINVAPQPGSVALSPDARYLLIGHFAPWEPPTASNNALTLIDLDTDRRQTFSVGYPVLGVAFGFDGVALVVTTNEISLFDPISGNFRVVDTVEGVAAQAFPDALGTFPPQITASSVTATRDGRRIFGVIDMAPNSDGGGGSGSSRFVRFSYAVSSGQLVARGTTASPKLGPRVVSVADDASYYMAGWALIGCDFRLMGNCDASGPLVSELTNTSGALNAGSHVIDSANGIIYAQAPEAGAAPDAPPVLRILDADNLTLRERILLPENLAGRSVLNGARDVVYSISDSGVMVLPVGLLGRAPRVAASQEDLVFRGNFCDRSVAVQEFVLDSPGGAQVPFALSTDMPGVEITPTSGMAPAVVTVRVDPNAFQNRNGTVTGHIFISAPSAINLPEPVRLLANNREPDQRGSFFNVPGKLVDILADGARERFYVLRQDKNQVLVFDARTWSQIATLRTANVPTQMAMTFDRHYLLVGHNDSQLAYVFDLETLEAERPIRFPIGHYPRSIAAVGRTILAASRVAGPDHTIDRVDFAARTATQLPSLGIYRNSVHEKTVLEAAPNGAAILAAMPDGNVMLFDATSDTFTISRKDFTSLSGAYAASNYGYFFVGDAMLNSSLVPVRRMDVAPGSSSSGFAFAELTGFRAMARDGGNGTVQRMSLATGETALATRIVESPVLTDAEMPFTRTLAPLFDRSSIIALTTSGFTVLPWTYDTAVAPPRLDSVVSAADGSPGVAPGGLISIYGRDLSPINVATREVPLPTALGESCLTVNGLPVPMLFVSPTQINAQLPFRVDGNAVLVLHTPGGVSDNMNLMVQPTAPGVFRSYQPGPLDGTPTVVRARNGELVTPANPIHEDDHIVIYLTGLGRTSPTIEAGLPAPSSPPASALIEPTVTLGSVPLPVHYAGLSPGQVGVYQINAQVPFRGVPAGMEVPLTISQGGASTTLLVRVVD